MKYIKTLKLLDKDASYCFGFSKVDHKKFWMFNVYAMYSILVFYF